VDGARETEAELGVEPLSSVSGAPPVVEGAASVVVPLRGVVLGMDGMGRVGSALDVGLCPAKELVATGGIPKDDTLSSETSTLEQESA
jgi:hypothetical protein